MSILSDVQLALKKSSEAHRKIDSIKSWKPDDTTLPVLYLSGDTSSMTKDNAVDLNYIYGERSGTLSCKWQGSSSLSYPKKNFTIKFDTAFEAKEGWGAQKKYCLKANYIDASHARNIVSATLWGRMVKTRSNADSRLTTLPNGGAIDGFPIIVYINNEYQGLYTWNIPKDAWMFGMGELDTEAIICADAHCDGTKFKTEVLVDGSDFELEYAPDEDDTSWVVTSINNLINACNVDTPDLDTIGQYIDIQSAIDYYIFACFVEGVDATDKNYLLGTYDGVKWFFSAYDLDTTFGNHWNGKSYYEHDQLSFADYASTHKMMELILANKKTELVTRYKELRADILSEANLLHLLSNFVCGIPSAAYEQESVIWPEIPGTKSNDINQIMEFMRVRLEWLDEQMMYSDFPTASANTKGGVKVGDGLVMGREILTDVINIVEPDEKLTILRQPGNIAAVAGDTVVFSVVAMGVSSYQWQTTSNGGVSWNNLSWDGATTATMTRTLNTTTVKYQYRCVLTGSDGNKAASDVVNIVTPSNEFTILRQPGNIAAVAGDTVVFSVVAMGVSSYQWQSSSDDGVSWVDLDWDGAQTAEMTHVLDADTVSRKYRCAVKYGDLDVLCIKEDVYTKNASLQNMNLIETTFAEGEFEYGYIKMSGEFFHSTQNIVTKDYIPESVRRIEVDVGKYQVAIAVYSGGELESIQSWYTGGMGYEFDPAKRYKVWIKTVDSSSILNWAEAIGSIRWYESVEVMCRSYHNMRAERSEGNDKHNKTLERIMRAEYNLGYANATAPIKLNSYLGNSQNIHPKVLYIPDGFGGHKYWMAYSPYPWAYNIYENPCVAFSDDGYEWTNINGNPLDDPAGEGYDSDPHLVYIEATGTMEVWYRYVGNYDVTPVPEIIYRQTSTNGVNWTAKEAVITNTSGIYTHYLSPSILHDGITYKMWFVDNVAKVIKYCESNDLSTINEIRTIKLDYLDGDNIYEPWHIDVIVDDGKTILLAMCKCGDKWSLFLATSNDNISFDVPYIVMRGNPYGWDKQLYRASVVNVNGEYRIYYSGIDNRMDYSETSGEKNIYGLGVSLSKTLTEFIGML